MVVFEPFLLAIADLLVELVAFLLLVLEVELFVAFLVLVLEVTLLLLTGVALLLPVL